jgi:hypothetical protein
MTGFSQSIVPIIQATKAAKARYGQRYFANFIFANEVINQVHCQQNLASNLEIYLKIFYHPVR